MIPVLDMHCDTISKIHDERLKGKEAELRNNPFQLDLEKMISGGYLCQNFALFTYLGAWRGLDDPYENEHGIVFETPYDYAISLSDTFDEEMKKNADLIRPVTTAEEIEQNRKEGRLSALKTIEEGGVYGGDPARVAEFYQKGVRMTTITWNFENELGFPNRINGETGEALPDFENGLKQKGKELVSLCRDLGILVDISHLNDAGIRDVFDVAGKGFPIVASHSNARTITGHPRNLTDENLRKLAECGGVAGINFCSAFLNDRDDKFSAIEDMVRHIEYIKNIGGIDVIGLGSDYDGIGNRVELTDGSQMQKLAEYLEDRGLAWYEIEKIFYKNALRVYREVL